MEFLVNIHSKEWKYLLKICLVGDDVPKLFTEFMKNFFKEVENLTFQTARQVKSTP